MWLGSLMQNVGSYIEPTILFFIRKKTYFTKQPNILERLTDCVCVE